MFSRLISKRAVRSFGTTASANGVFKEKSFVQAWCQDVGAYPVMSVIVVAAVFSLGTGFWFMVTHPDNRISKTNRKSIFRGPLVGTQ